MNKTSFEIQSTDKHTGKITTLICRYTLRQAAETEAQRLQTKANAVGRPVLIRAVPVIP